MFQSTIIFLVAYGYFSDTLPKTIKYRHFCICNTDVKSGEGKHWICFVRNHKNNVELFDSLGVDSEKSLLLKKYCKFRVNKLVFNETAFQDRTSDTCGKFVLYFAIERMHNLDLSFEDLLHELFDDQISKNEEKVKTFCDSVLNKASK